MKPMPMFPLGTVLFPSLLLPLHVFEPRYQALIEHCLEGDREFGVVLIERGSEVGGGDVRYDVGTVAEIVESARAEDGRFAILCAGTRRIRIEKWLPDEPFPQAQVADWPEADSAIEQSEERLADLLVAAKYLFAKVSQLREQLGEPAAPVDEVVANEPWLASFQLSGLSPFGPADQQKLLAMPGTNERLSRLVGQLAEEAEFLDQRLLLD